MRCAICRYEGADIIITEENLAVVICSLCAQQEIHVTVCDGEIFFLDADFEPIHKEAP